MSRALGNYDCDVKVINNTFYFSLHDSYTPATAEVTSYNILRPSARPIPTLPHTSSILSSELVLPANNDMHVSRSHCALHMLASLDTLAASHEAGMIVVEVEKERQSIARVYTKEDFNTVTRFEGRSHVDEYFKT